MSRKYKALLFDVDGTLITSGGAGAESWKLAFDECTESQPTSASSPTTG